MPSTLWNSLRTTLDVLRNRSRFEHNLDEELRDHIERDIEHRVARGASLAEARRAALATLGGVGNVKEQLRAAHGVDRIDALRADVRLAMRQLMHAPGIAVAVVLCLALGIGLNVATFGVVNALLFRPPAGTSDASRTYHLRLARPVTIGEQMTLNTQFSTADKAALESRKNVFADVGGWSEIDAIVESPSGTARTPAVLADAAFFRALGIHPFRGRLFGATEDAAGPESAPVVVLSHAWWMRAFGGDSSIIGRPIRIAGRQYSVIGIAAERFAGVGIRPAELFIPLQMSGALGAMPWAPRSPQSLAMDLVVRLQDGESRAAAAEAASATLASLDASSGMRIIGYEKTGRRVRLAPLNERFVDQKDAPVPAWMLAATATVLLVVCANVAGLLLVRAERRRREIATRAALGASRGRIVRQLLVEGLLLALGGGVVGVGVAWISLKLLPLVPNMIALDHVLDLRALTVAFVITTVATLLFALAPALIAARTDPAALLRSGGRGTQRSQTFGIALLAAQFAASLVLLSATGLFVRSLGRVRGVDLGFDSRHSLELVADWEGMGVSADRIGPLLSETRDLARTMPNVADAALVAMTPFTGMSMSSLRLPNQEQQTLDTGLPGGMVFTNAADQRYFSTLGIPLTAGRAFTDPENSGAVPAAIVNAAMAKVLWPSRDPIGQCLLLGKDNACTPVVGVVRDFRFASFGSAPGPLLVRALGSPVAGNPSLVLRVNGDERAMPIIREQLRAQLLSALRARASNVRVVDVRPVGEPGLRAMLAPRQLAASAFGAFGAIALLLAAIGLSGSVAYSVSQRAAEFGIRSALGARSHALIRLALARGVGGALAGAGVGVLAAIAVGRLLEKRLFGVAPTDVLSLGGAALLLGAVVVIAAWIPARRAARVEPAKVLRVA